MPLTDYGRKPKVRAWITRQWQDAYKNGDVEAVALRASDFYGPGAANSYLANFALPNLKKGKSVPMPYNPDLPHDLTYVPDIARAVLDLSAAPSSDYGQAWHVPNAPVANYFQHLTMASEILDVKLRMMVLPLFAMRLIGLFDRQFYELYEMKFQFDRPYHVDSSKFVNRFGWQATPFREGIEATIKAIKA